MVQEVLSICGIIGFVASVIMWVGRAGGYAQLLIDFKAETEKKFETLANETKASKVEILTLIADKMDLGIHEEKHTSAMGALAIANESTNHLRVEIQTVKLQASVLESQFKSLEKRVDRLESNMNVFPWRQKSEG